MDMRQKIELYIQEVQKYFPGLDYSSAYSMFSTENNETATSGKIELSASFFNEIALKDGPVQIIHYTGLEKAMNILNSGKIRLYNCLNLNDPSEIKYLLDKSPVTFSQDQIEAFKRDFFILSGCHYNDTNDEDYNLWRLYGDSGKGIGLVLEIDENAPNWKDFYLQFIAYGLNSTYATNILDFLNFHEAFNHEHNLFENIPELFGLFATGVKNEIWSIEKEFRISVFIKTDPFSLEPEPGFKSNQIFEKMLRHEFKSDGRLVSYIEMPIHKNDYEPIKVRLHEGTEEVELNDYLPNLKLKKIILGPNNPAKESDRIYFDFEGIISKFLNYRVPIVDSSIRV